MLFSELKSVLFTRETLHVKVFRKVASTLEVVETATLNYRNDPYAYDSFLKTHSDHVVSDLFSTIHGLSIYLDEPEEPTEMPEISNIREMFEDFSKEIEECGVGGLL